ncbi:spore cortex-lytic enzyme [Alicyclobacillus acidiphilus]
MVLALVGCATPFAKPATVQAFTARNLIYGSQGYDVNELQGRLHLLGYYWGKNDGIFGWKTYWSVRTFQYNFGLPVTGDVDMKTKMKLVSATPNWNVSMDGNGPETSGSSSTQGTAGTTQASASSPTPASGTQPSPAASAVAAGFSTSIDGISPNDLNLMAHVVYGEARGESFEGQVAIAAVIMNRLKDPKFPRTIPGIIYAPGAFDAVSDGQVNLQPDAEAREAVAEAVEGWDPTHGALFYFNPAKTNNAWMWARPEIITIGHHIFTS